MDIHEFLAPVPYEVKPENHSNYQVIDIVNFDDLDQIDDNSIVLCGLGEYQDYFDIEDQHFSLVRNHFFQLSKSNWKKKIYDIGTVLAGQTVEDSCFALHQVTQKIVDRGALLIVLGGSQAMSYILYEAIQKDLMKVATVDIKLDIDGSIDNLSQDNHITKMILNEEHRLLDFFNLGSQAPYVAKEELDILEQLNFENIRLGKITEDVSKAEPLLREIDLLSVDMNAMQHNTFKAALKTTPNGFNSREICALMRYAGLNDHLKVLHISNFYPEPSSVDSYLLAEMLWYFIEAQNNQKIDGELERYRVQLEEDEVIFIKSPNSERWWLQMIIDNQKRNIPCNYEDYLTALGGEYPDIWLKFFKKFY
ncbi:MAG: arginase family protein [Weeksellaceae bacterium]